MAGNHRESVERRRSLSHSLCRTRRGETCLRADCQCLFAAAAGQRRVGWHCYRRERNYHRLGVCLARPVL